MNCLCKKKYKDEKSDAYFLFSCRKSNKMLEEPKVLRFKWMPGSSSRLLIKSPFVKKCNNIFFCLGTELDGLTAPKICVQVVAYPNSHTWIWIGDSSSQLSNMSFAINVPKDNKTTDIMSIKRKFPQNDEVTRLFYSHVLILLQL